ncbi:MAG TPA: hypothetical protein VLE49_16830, partial [Anaerolineales bacterium]|nr:hypothetical protein [Anaerolineales bacterium]
PNYFATGEKLGIQIHQYTNMEISQRLGEHNSIALKLETEYPWDGRVKITVAECAEQQWKLALRVPGWCQTFSMKVNHQEARENLQKGYVTVERVWKAGDVVQIEFAMPPFLVEADPRVDSVRGCVALQRGPVVYCLEQHDQVPGVNLLDAQIDPAEELASHWQGDLLGGVMTLQAAGYRSDRSDWSKQELYRPLIRRNKDRSPDQRVKLIAIPYYAWGNRGLQSMRVWIPYS